MSYAQNINSQFSNVHDNVYKAWIDIFFGIINTPIQTINSISSSETYSPNMGAILGSTLVVVLSGLTRAPADSCCLSPSDIGFSLFISVLVNLFFWLIIATFVRLLATLIQIETSIRTCLIVCGWAFSPLLFKAVGACFSHVSILGNLLSWCSSAWFLALELFAFDSILKLGRLKTLGIVLMVPPCLYFVYFLSMIFAGLLITDGLL